MWSAAPCHPQEAVRELGTGRHAVCFQKSPSDPSAGASCQEAPYRDYMWHRRVGEKDAVWWSRWVTPKRQGRSSTKHLYPLREMALEWRLGSAGGGGGRGRAARWAWPCDQRGGPRPAVGGAPRPSPASAPTAARGRPTPLPSRPVPAPPCRARSRRGRHGGQRGLRSVLPPQTSSSGPAGRGGGGAGPCMPRGPAAGTAALSKYKLTVTEERALPLLRGSAGSRRRRRRGWKRWRGRRREAAAGPVPVRGGRCGASLAASPPSPAGNMAAAAQDELSKCSRRRDSQRGLARGRAGGRPGVSPQRVSSAMAAWPPARPGADSSRAGPALGGHLGKRKAGIAAPPASLAPPRTRRLRDLAGRERWLLAGTEPGVAGTPGSGGAASARHSWTGTSGSASARGCSRPALCECRVGTTAAVWHKAGWHVQGRIPAAPEALCRAGVRERSAAAPAALGTWPEVPLLPSIRDGGARPCLLVTSKTFLRESIRLAALWRCLWNLKEKAVFLPLLFLAWHKAGSYLGRVNSKIAYDSAEWEGLWLPWNSTRQSSEMKGRRNALSIFEHYWLSVLKNFCVLFLDLGGFSFSFLFVLIVSFCIGNIPILLFVRCYWN